VTRHLAVFVIFMLGLPILSYAQQNPYAQGGIKTYTTEQQTRDVGQNQANLMLKYENMLTKIGELTGKIEELRHSNELLQNKTDKMNVKIGKLENEISALKGRAHVTTTVATPPKVPVITTAPPKVPVKAGDEKKSAYRLDAKKAYDKAKSIFDAKKYVKAMTAFREFSKSFPDSHYLSNTKFWIAECYYKLGEYDKAILAYDEVINNYPNSPKMPDAYYKEGLSFMKLGDDIDGRFLLKKVIKLYPNSVQAREARKILEKK